MTQTVANIAHPRRRETRRVITTPGSATMTLLHRARNLLTQDLPFHTFRAVSNNFLQKGQSHENATNTHQFVGRLFAASFHLCVSSDESPLPKWFRVGAGVHQNEARDGINLHEICGH